MVMVRVRILVCLILVVLYLLAPLDIIPEMVLGVFGYIDDLFIIVIVSIYISMIYRGYLAQQDAAAGPTHAHVD